MTAPLRASAPKSEAPTEKATPAASAAPQAHTGPHMDADLDAAVDDEALATKMQTQATRHTRDTALDDALGVDHEPVRRAIPLPRSRDKFGRLDDKGGYFDERYEDELLKNASPALKQLQSSKNNEFFRYDWLRNPAVKDAIGMASSPFTPPDVGGDATPGYRLTKPPPKGAIGELTRVFKDYDWGDSRATAHVLMMYPWAEYIWVGLSVFLFLKLFNYQIDNHSMIFYDEYLGLDLRMVPRAERGIIGMFTFGFIFFLIRHPLMVASVTIQRLYRIARGRHMGPP